MTSIERKEYGKKWREKNKEKICLDGKTRREKHPGREAARKKKWRLENPEKSLSHRQKDYEKWKKRHPGGNTIPWRKSRYGITEEQFQGRISSQEGKCPICDLPFGGTPNIDHCHQTGKIRGLLCHKCNKALGLLNENFATVIRAANYLRKSLPPYQVA